MIRRGFMTQVEFPEQFVWGVATAAYQIEGAVHEEGRTPSVWDMFCEKAGAIFGGHDGAVAADHYHRFREDVVLMRELGAQGYRFSISWPRVLPDGVGTPNPQGIAFYDRLVDELLNAGITPFATLFHWDMPLSLYHRGGWLNRQSVEWFAEYAELMGRTLGDRVRDWVTLNEPQVFIGYGHYDGKHAPGLRFSLAEMLRCGHHALLAHGRAVQALRASSSHALRIGFAPMGFPKLPASDSPADLEAARRVMYAVQNPDHWNLCWWADPVLLGSYPEDGVRLFGRDAPTPAAGDLELISQPVDFLGLNLYQGVHIQADAAGEPSIVPPRVGAPLTAFNWQVTPAALYWGPKWAYQRYGKPIVVTENGLSCRDWVSLDGRVHDPQRIDFLTRYLRELHRAIADGVPIHGYYHWSLLDNFEWAEGYRERFGLVFVDYESGARTPKDSYYWYRAIIASRGRAALDESAVRVHLDSNFESDALAVARALSEPKFGT